MCPGWSNAHGEGCSVCVWQVEALAGCVVGYIGWCVTCGLHDDDDNNDNHDDDNNDNHDDDNYDCRTDDDNHDDNYDCRTDDDNHDDNNHDDNNHDDNNHHDNNNHGSTLDFVLTADASWLRSR